MTGSYDPELNLIYWGIGNPAPDFDGDVRKGDNLYTESMVALDADTGKLKWYFQYTPHDVHDWDAVEIPVLVDAAIKASAASCWFRPIATASIMSRSHERQIPSRQSIHQSAQLGEGPDSRRQTDSRARSRSRRYKALAHVPPPRAPPISTRPPIAPITGLFYVTIMEGCGINYKSRDTFRPGGVPSWRQATSKTPKHRGRPMSERWI